MPPSPDALKINFYIFFAFTIDISGTPQDETECLMYGKESLCKYRSRKPEGVAVELADAVIRIADLCGHLEIDLEEVIEIKMAYNEGRPYKHGKKF